VCAFTSVTVEAPLFRLRVEPSERNGLLLVSSLMVDKLTTVSKEKLGARIGSLDAEDLVRLDRAIMVFLGLAGSPS
jgi:mRNA interferase MazF